MKQFLIFILTFFITHSAFGQRVTDIFFYQDGQKINIQYNLEGARYYQNFNVTVYVSTDGGKTFKGPLEKVEGDVGLNIVPGQKKNIVWDVFEEMPDFGGDVAFQVKAVINEEKLERKIYGGYKGSLTAPFGLTIGLTGKTGFYLSARFNQNVTVQNDYETEGESVIDYNESGYYSYTDKVKTKRLSITGGVQFQASRKLHVYLGGGYSIYKLLWEIDKFDYNDTNKGSSWVKNNSESFGKIEAECGLMLDFGKIYISGGVTSPGFKWVEPTLSLGVCL